MITIDSGLIALFLLISFPCAFLAWLAWLEYSDDRPSQAERYAEKLERRWGGATWQIGPGQYQYGPFTPTERQILAADKAARLRVAERLTEWADASVMAGMKHRDDPEKRARYGAQARALFAAAAEITRHDRPVEKPE